MTKGVFDPFEEWRSTRRLGSSPETPKATLPDGTAAMDRVWKTPGEVEKQARQMLHAWNEREKPKGLSSPAFVFGLVIFLCLPFIGWFIGAFLMLFAFSDGKTKEQRQRQDGERLAQLRRELSSLYRNVKCPRCRGPLTVGEEKLFVFLSVPEGIDCPVCKTRLVRRGDTLSVLAAALHVSQ